MALAACWICVNPQADVRHSRHARVADDLTVAEMRGNETLAAVGAGASLKVSSAASSFFGANSETNAESSGESANVNFMVRF